MDFRTIVPVSNQSPKINYDANIALFGSCFVENIGDKLQYFKFNVLQNPFGIIFHPVALRNLFQRIDENYIYIHSIENVIFLLQGENNFNKSIKVLAKYLIKKINKIIKL